MPYQKRLGSVSYDGTNYSGFSISIGKTTVQQVLEEKITKVFTPIEKTKNFIEFTSRTDAGVHALDQLIVFDAPDYFENQKLKSILNQRKPHDIVFNWIQSVPNTYNLRDDVLSKEYVYVISSSPDNLFLNRYSWAIRKPPNLSSLNNLLSLLIGKHDFACFSKESRRYESTICEIYELECKQNERVPIITIRINGNRFLYNMIRRIIGFSIFLCEKDRTIPCTYEELISQYRSQTSMRAPSSGLFLAKVNLRSYSL